MTDPSVIWMMLDQILPEDYYSEDKWDLFLQLKTLYEETGDSLMAANVAREIRLLNRIVAKPGDRSDVWGWCLANPGEPFRDWKRNDTAYYQSRIQQSKSNLQRARYAYATWVFQKDNPDFAATAIENYLRVGEEYIRNAWFNEYSKVISTSLGLALEVSAIIPLTTPHDMVTVLKRTHDALAIIQQKGEKGEVILDIIRYIRSTADLLRHAPLARFPKDLETQFEKAIHVSERCGKLWADKKEFEWERNYYLEAAHLARSLLLDHEVFTRKIAESFEHQAVIQGSLLAEAAFLECAQAYYEELKDENAVNNLKTVIQKKMQDAFASGELDAPTAVHQAIKEIARLRSNSLIARSGSSTLQELVKLSIWPDSGRISKEIQENLAQMRGKIPDEIKIDRIDIYQQNLDTPTEILEYNTNMRYAFEARITELLIIELFSKVFSGVIAADDLERYFRQNRFIQDNDFEAFMRVYHTYLAKDYYVTIHLSLVLIERVLFQLIKEQKQSLIRLNPLTKRAELLTFDQLLQAAKGVIAPDLLAYLQSRFSNLGMGLHEIITRGFLKISDYTPSLAAACLLCVIQLTNQ